MTSVRSLASTSPPLELEPSMIRKMSFKNPHPLPMDAASTTRQSFFRNLQVPERVVRPKSRASVRRQDTMASVYSYDDRSRTRTRSQGPGHGEIDMGMRHRESTMTTMTRPDLEKMRYRSNRDPESVKSFFDNLDDDREEKRSNYSAEESSGNGLANVLSFFVNGNILMRWFWCIIPLLIIIWIPGIVGVTAQKNGKVFGVRLLWWSVWLTIAWLGLWGGLVVARLLPPVVRGSVGVVFPRTRQAIDWLSKLYRYVAVVAWSIAMFVSFSPLLRDNATEANGRKVLDVFWKLLLAQLILTSILLGEKLLIQWIASRFNRRAYADRVENQQWAVYVLSRLCEAVGWAKLGHDVDGAAAEARKGHESAAAAKVKNVTFGAVSKARTAVNAFANELSGSNVVEQSPEMMVMHHLVTEEKARALATSLFSNLLELNTDKEKPRIDNENLLVDDLHVAFPLEEERKKAFDLFDKDGNGDVSLEEVQMACIDLHKEENNLIHSQRDVKSAVGRLNAIFMILYFVIVILVLAICLEAQALTLVTGAGAFMLGLSWLIGGPIQEVITSIIFLFIKHPYDDGDRVRIEEEVYIVREIRLLSTIFMNKNGSLVQAPNSVLSTKFIENVRRSKQMTETFEFEVAYATTNKQISDLQERMKNFVAHKNRDFLPEVYIAVQDIPEQDNLVLAADIRYKSNWQHTDIKVRRRNEWINALKQAMSELEIYGPKGKPEASKPDIVVIPVATDMKTENVDNLDEPSSTRVIVPTSPVIEVQMPTPTPHHPTTVQESPSGSILKKRPLPNMPEDVPVPYDSNSPQDKPGSRPYTATYAKNPYRAYSGFPLPPTRPLSVGAKVAHDPMIIPESQDFVAQYRDDYSDISSPGYR